MTVKAKDAAGKYINAKHCLIGNCFINGLCITIGLAGIGSVSSQSTCESGATFTVKAMGCQRGQLYPHRLP